MKRVTFLLVLFLLAPAARSAGPDYDRIADAEFASRSEVIAEHGMAATSHPLATQVAVDILKAGGSAVDAAIAANATLGLMEPTGCGIGGDLFAIVWDAKAQKLHGLNASGPAPAAMTLDYFRTREIDELPRRGPLIVSVPGAVAGWFALHDKFGKLPVSDVLAPAVDYAEHGFPMAPLIAYYWQRNTEVLKDMPGVQATYMPGGRAPKVGEKFRNPRLAATYRKIAEGGHDAFYKGEIARTIAQHMADQGGLMTYADLAQFEAEWIEPVSTNYRGWEVYELPPNGQGIAALQILNILEGFDIQSMGFDSAEYIHAFVEAKKLAYEDRAKYYADMAFADVPVDWLISKEYAAERRALITDKAANAYSAGDDALDVGDTIYLTTADRDGNMVSLIQSNYRGMGSGVVPGELGFMMQDRAALFSLDEGHRNVVAGGKRPFHTIIPAFAVKDGKPLLSFGVMGGQMQPQGHAQIVINMVDFGMNVQEAGDAARINHTGSSQPYGNEVMEDGGVVQLEQGFAETTLADLKKKGHEVGHARGIYGGYQAIYKNPETGMYHGASEVRKDGQAAGY